MTSTVRHRIPSECWSSDDDPAAQSFNGWDYVTNSIRTAANCRIDCSNPFANAFPGDHYRLLAGLIYNLAIHNDSLSLVDIGTHYGTSARVMLDFSPEKSQVTTFDINAWENYETTYLTEQDFESGRLTQYLDDLKDDSCFAKHADLLMNADFIMCDGPKDGIFERKVYKLLSTLKFPTKTRWLLLDDIRFPSEMGSWRLISSPKIDLTSFGHFSGTGLVNITEGLRLA